MVDDSKNNIEKALAAIDTALEVEPVGEEIQLDSTVQFDGFEMMEDGSAEQITDDVQIDRSNVPFNANLAEYISDDELSKFSADLVKAFEADNLSHSFRHKLIRNSSPQAAPYELKLLEK